MDGWMSMKAFYAHDVDRKIVALVDNAEPFSASALKNCPLCRGPLRSLNRYSRITRRALIDEATKKFIIWVNRESTLLVKRMEEVEAGLRDSAGESQNGLENSATNFSSVAVTGVLSVVGTRDQQNALVSQLTRGNNKYAVIMQLRREIKKFLRQVSEKEQPFGRIYDLVQEARTHRGVESNLSSTVDLIQVGNRLLATVLLIRCDYTVLLTILDDLKGEISALISLKAHRKDCKTLITESHSKHQQAKIVKGHLYWARFASLEQSFAKPGDELDQLMNEARDHLELATSICDDYPGQTIGMRSEVSEAETMLRGSTFYLPVSNEEKAAVYAAMATDFSRTGHWYHCENGHPFTVGECGMPMQTSRCPQCGATVGGRNHEAADGVTHAADIDEQFGRLGL